MTMKHKNEKTSRKVLQALTFGLFCAAAGFLGLVLFSGQGAFAQGKTYVGWAQCGSCHEDHNARVLKTRHKVLFLKETANAKTGCEACHGPASLHLETPGEEIVKFKEIPAKEANKICLACHSSKEGKGWNAGAHNKNNVSCITCHNPHKETDKFLKESKIKTCTNCHVEKKGQVSMPSKHPVKEGKVACSDCHNPHGNTKTEAKDMKQACVKCHAEKRGPFAFEHRPASEDCLSCHSPHGTANQSLLVLKQPVLCLQCHGPQDVGTVTSFHDLSQSQYRTCTGCHQDIHGSNTSDKFLKQ